MRDTKYMRTALRLAQRGIGSVEPNPAVGAVIVKANQIIGRGWHKKFGDPHAEINAIEDCKTLGSNPQSAVMYVTLEPCSHQGKTAPCTEAIIAAGLTKVVVAALDPSEHASGKGIEQLRNAGIKVETGLCEKEAKLINAPFIKFAATGRCWTVLKWAQTIDGKMAQADNTQGHQWISNQLSRKDVHKLRQRVGAILVGINTVIADDPLLTARPDKGKKLIRVVLDSNLQIPLDCKLLATAKEAPLLIVASQQAHQANPQLVEEITQTGAEVLVCPDAQGQSNLPFVLDELSKRRIAQLLVEGGPTVISSFLKENLADEICVYISPKILGGSGSVDISGPMAQLTAGFSLHHVVLKPFGDDVRITGLTKGALSELGL
ncbi:MAG: bifunctional diaminohydroxyphosphoribosylaminopyrimidine deaminase/5-amino-6-(5-phosphoribosylamino)uracil reductase RibD [Planctomycetota bacterium]|nr:MAG: bifunctional diaminohydroxyphosphoribosylaminopyrimidine deaminase/5-amino-6-(5-phosphoribosylamino)uracil reductase RibD [Planctomycetota bacterium]